jgi:gamma-glutamylcyclotransferase (GGCT)/AIG2-like uncharacterized protein YtfP
MRLFLYGTLLRPELLARFAGRLPRLTPADLPGWRRVCLRGTRYPTLRRARASVRGATVDVGATALRRLDAYEGVRYRRVRLTVRGPRRPLPAQAWIAQATTPRPWP